MCIRERIGQFKKEEKEKQEKIKLEAWYINHYHHLKFQIHRVDIFHGTKCFIKTCF